MGRLSLEEAMKLLDVKTIPGKSWQLERLRKQMERLVDTRGKSYVWENRRELLNQWEQYSKPKFKSCL